MYYVCIYIWYLYYVYGNNWKYIYHYLNLFMITFYYIYVMYSFISITFCNNIPGVKKHTNRTWGGLTFYGFPGGVYQIISNSAKMSAFHQAIARTRTIKSVNLPPPFSFFFDLWVSWQFIIFQCAHKIQQTAEGWYTDRLKRSTYLEFWPMDVDESTGILHERKSQIPKYMLSYLSQFTTVWDFVQLAAGHAGA